MIKNFKQSGIATLPPSFFSLVNTMAVALMAVAKEDLKKIKRFVKFWIEKIEIEVVFEEEEYEYAKFLLRNTLCTLHSELKEHEDCLKESNLNVREISSHVEPTHPDEKRERRRKRKRKTLGSGSTV